MPILILLLTRLLSLYPLPICSMRLSRSLLSLNSLRFLYFHNADKWPKNIYEGVKAGCSVTPNFITEAEEQQLLKEIEPYLKRLKYEESHWDDRLLNTFPSDIPASSSVHILDLHKDGAILPHVDSVKVISMILFYKHAHLQHVEKKDELFVDLHLPRLSLYKLSGVGRYEFMHEVLHEDESYHGMDKVRIVKDRRISLICRDEPKAEQMPGNKVEFKAIPAHE
ncbi:hypothetical protein Ddc_05050 [Ditylenchus destructor]|nr:hypothetical protein Ddc_05050 [Ditylenchus destructor]